MKWRVIVLLPLVHCSQIYAITDEERAFLDEYKNVSQFLESSCENIVTLRREISLAGKLGLKVDVGADKGCVELPQPLQVEALKKAADVLPWGAIGPEGTAWGVSTKAGIKAFTDYLYVKCTSPLKKARENFDIEVKRVSQMKKDLDATKKLFVDRSWKQTEARYKVLEKTATGSNEFETARQAAVTRAATVRSVCKAQIVDAP